MKRALALLIVAMTITIIGCTDADLIRWRPSEDQKKNADLAVQAADELSEVTPDSHAEVGALARKTTRVNQRYIGQPEEIVRLEDYAEANAVADRASQDAAQRPTLEQGAEYTIDKTAGVVGALLSGAAGVAGIWGFGKVRGRMKDYKQDVDRLSIALKETVQSVGEAMREAIPPETMAEFKDLLAKRQSPKTRAEIDKAKAATRE